MASDEVRLDNLRNDKELLEEGDVSFWIKLDVPGLRPNIAGQKVTPTTQAAIKRALNAHCDVINEWVLDEMRKTAGEIFLKTF